MDAGFLKETDLRILRELDRNVRIPFSEIAKKAGISKQRVIYRVNGFVKKGFILKFGMLANISKLGLNYYRLHIQLQNTNEEIEKRIIGYFVENEKVAWLSRCDGRFDLLIGIMAENALEFNEELQSIVNKFGEFILKYEFNIIIDAPVFSRTFFSEEDRPETKGHLAGGFPVVKTDETDLEIIALLSRNARASLAELSKKIGIPAETVNYRMRKLIRAKVLISHMQLNYKILGLQLYKTMFYLKNFPEERLNELKGFGKFHPYVLDVIQSIGPWQIEFDIEAKSPEHYHEIIKEIRRKFSDIIRDYDSLYIVNELKLNFSPRQ